MEVHNTAEFWRRPLQAAYWPVVRDRQGALVGMLPAAGRDLLAGVPAVTRADIAPACIDLLIAREDRHAVTWRQLFGINMLALPRVLILKRGGSTLPMQVADCSHLSGAACQRWIANDLSWVRRRRRRTCSEAHRRPP